MDIIVSKKDKSKFYLPLVGESVLHLLIITACLLAFFKLRHDEAVGTGRFLFLIIGLAMAITAGITIRKYYKETPNIRVEQGLITINNHVLSFGDIEGLAIVGRRPPGHWLGYSQLNLQLHLKGGSAVLLPFQRYENGIKMVGFLDHIITGIKPLPDATTHVIKRIELKAFTFTSYKDRQWTSFQGIMLWLLLAGFTLTMCFSKDSVLTKTISILGFDSFWFFFNSWQMDYFELSDQYLVIKNHNLPWVFDAHELSDIREIFVETAHKMPTSLRVVTRDFRCYTYPAATLRRATWTALTDQLNRLQIPVRDTNYLA